MYVWMYEWGKVKLWLPSPTFHQILFVRHFVSEHKHVCPRCEIEQTCFHTPDIVLHIQRNDSYGRPVAARPVLVKGRRVWYEIPNTGIVTFFEHEGTGIPVNWYYYAWGQDHNVVAKEESWGYGADPEGCDHCHVPEINQTAPVFDRLILIDPYGPDGQPVYETVREMTGLNPIG